MRALLFLSSILGVIQAWNLHITPNGDRLANQKSGDNFLVVCSVQDYDGAASDVKIHWYREGTQIGFGRIMTIGKPNASQLMIIKAKKEDSSDYVCKAEIDGVTQEINASINFIRAPEFIQPLIEQHPEEGRTAEIVCRVEGEPSMEVFWQFNGNTLDEASPRGYEFKDNNQVLVIANYDSKKDDGHYLCNAAQFSSFETLTINVSGYSRPMITVFDGPTNNQGFEGQSVHFKCGAIGKPMPTYKWYRGESEEALVKSDIYGIEDGLLTIQSLTSTDGGEYRCVATNDIGTDSKTATLSVYLRPKVERLTNHTKQSGENVELVCRYSGEGTLKAKFVYGQQVFKVGGEEENDEPEKLTSDEDDGDDEKKEEGQDDEENDGDEGDDEEDKKEENNVDDDEEKENEDDKNDDEKDDKENEEQDDEDKEDSKNDDEKDDEEKVKESGEKEEDDDDKKEENEDGLKADDEEKNENDDDSKDEKDEDEEKKRDEKDGNDGNEEKNDEKSNNDENDKDDEKDDDNDEEKTDNDDDEDGDKDENENNEDDNQGHPIARDEDGSGEHQPAHFIDTNDNNVIRRTREVQSGRVSVTDDGKQITLLIKDVSLNDAGTYQCVVENEAGPIIRNSVLAITHAPIIKKWTDQTVRSFEGHEIEIFCEGKAVPEPNWDWQLNGQDVEHDGVTTKITNTFTRSSIWMRTTEGKYGRYICRASNGVGEPAEKVVTVIEVVTPPTPTELNCHDDVNPNFALCALNAEQYADLKVEPTEVEFAWVPDQEALKEGFEWERDSVKHKVPYASRMKVPGLKPKSNYIIRARAINEAGASDLGVQETVETTDPWAPAQPESITYECDQVCRIEWTEPNNHGEELTGYKVTVQEYKENEEKEEYEYIGSRLEISLGTDGQAIELTQLKPNTNYEISVSAKNSIGESEPQKVTFETPATVVPHSASGITSTHMMIIVGAALFIVCLVVDLICYSTNRCGVIACICINCCGKNPDRSKGKDLESGRPVESNRLLSDQRFRESPIPLLKSPIVSQV
ncbi:unnamed protein product, partial [Mesorhabditis belari]|uniref:Uncharacterized protein n=1 Tax=Mesorhabditis belari TaxID=2138241 RepID=A0AAF3ETS2_9BILA